MSSRPGFFPFPGFAGEVKKVHQLRAARRFGGKRKPPLPGEHINGGGFAGVAASGKGNLGQSGRGQLIDLRGGRQKTGGFKQRHDETFLKHVRHRQYPVPLTLYGIRTF